MDNTALPDCLLIEVSSICNADCIFCPQARYNRNRQHMPLPLYEKVISDYAEHGGTVVSLTPMHGEPLLSPHILDMANIAREYKFRIVHMYTNAINLDSVGFRELLDSGLTSLSLSLAPPDRSMYTRIVQRPTYDRAMKNVSKVLSCFKTLKSKISVQKIKLEFRGPVKSSEIRVMKDFKKNLEPFLCKGVEISAMTEFDSWFGAVSDNDLLPGMNIKRPPKEMKIPCAMLNFLRVTESGRFRLCGCRIAPGETDEFDLGSIEDVSLIEAFGSEKARQIYQGFIDNNPPDICLKCSWYNTSIGANLKLKKNIEVTH